MFQPEGKRFSLCPAAASSRMLRWRTQLAIELLHVGANYLRGERRSLAQRPVAQHSSLLSVAVRNISTENS